MQKQHVFFQVLLERKFLATYRTAESLAVMQIKMLLQVMLHVERLPTDLTLIRLVTQMLIEMSLQADSRREPFSTLQAPVRSTTIMHSIFVFLEIAIESKTFWAEWALERLLACVYPVMFFHVRV